MQHRHSGWYCFTVFGSTERVNSSLWEAIRVTCGKTSYPYRKMFPACEIVRHRCGLHTVTFSKSASEEVGDKGLMGLREGELPTLETYSGSGTYRTCKHNPRLYLHRQHLCAPHTKDKHTHARTHRQQVENLSHSSTNVTRQITWNQENSFMIMTQLTHGGKVTVMKVSQCVAIRDRDVMCVWFHV